MGMGHSIYEYSAMGISMVSIGCECIALSFPWFTESRERIAGPNDMILLPACGPADQYCTRLKASGGMIICQVLATFVALAMTMYARVTDWRHRTIIGAFLLVVAITFAFIPIVLLEEEIFFGLVPFGMGFIIHCIGTGLLFILFLIAIFETKYKPTPDNELLDFTKGFEKAREKYATELLERRFAKDTNRQKRRDSEAERRLSRANDDFLTDDDYRPSTVTNISNTHPGITDHDAEPLRPTRQGEEARPREGTPDESPALSSMKDVEI